MHGLGKTAVLGLQDTDFLQQVRDFVLEFYYLVCKLFAVPLLGV